MNRKTFLSSLLTLITVLAACTTPRQQHNEDVINFNAIKGIDNDFFYVVTIDSCEYIVFRGNSKGGIIHKANCKNHRN